MPLSNALVV